jgi:serine/threonine protein kinase
MGDTLKMPDSEGPIPGAGGVDVTTKVCGDCGGTFTGDSHKDCKSSGSSKSGSSAGSASSSKKGGAPSSKSHIDDIPEEARAVESDLSRQLNQYILVKQIGKGGMGAVWKAWDRKLTRWVAIKFLLVSDEEDVARFQREAKLAARLRHPNIAPIYEVGEAPAQQAGQTTRHYLAMEYIDGSSMASATNLPINELLDIFMKVASGIEAAHKAGVVHRDLKPQNVMLTSDKWPYVMDFGLAKAIQAESSLSVSGAIMGTPAYMPPEQAQGRLDAIDGQTDIYSLGATMYAVLCKKQPFTGQTPMEILMKVCREEPAPPRSHNPEIPEAIEAVILKSMAKEKADRYPTAQALADDLKRYLSNQDVEARAPSSIKLAARQMKRNVWPLVASAAVLVAGGVVGVVLMKKPEEKPVPPPPPVVVQNPTPVVTPPPPQPVENPAVKKEAEWFKGWIEVRDLLDYDDWKAGDATLAGRANRLLKALTSDAPVKEADVRDWFSNQTDKAETRLGRLSGSLEEKRAGAARIVGWCDVVVAAAKDVDFVKRYADGAARTRAEAARIADYKGSFTLRAIVGPYAQLTKVTRGGKDVPVPQRATPLVIAGLEIGDYELEFSHPQLGKKTVKLEAARLKDGRTLLISGRMQDAQLRVAE